MENQDEYLRKLIEQSWKKIRHLIGEVYIRDNTFEDLQEVLKERGIYNDDRTDENQ